VFTDVVAVDGNGRVNVVVGVAVVDKPDCRQKSIAFSSIGCYGIAVGRTGAMSQSGSIGCSQNPSKRGLNLVWY